MPGPTHPLESPPALGDAGWSGDAGFKAAPPPKASEKAQWAPGAYLPWRVQSVYSFREGLLWPKDLAARAKALGMASLALADRDGLWGAVPFVQACQAEGIKPILGALVAVEAGGHLPLFARNATGWRHLCRLLSQSLLEAPLSWGDLAQQSEGLLALGGGDEGPMGLALAAGDRPLALAHARAFAKACPEAAFLEAPRPESAWRSLAAESGLPVVAAWPTRYLDAKDERLWRLLRQGHHQIPPEVSSFHLATPEAARRAWLHWPEALAQSLAWDSWCDFELPMGLNRLPRLPEVEDPEASLRALCEAALPGRYGPHPGAAVRERLAHELATICAMGFADYFLIQAEIVAWCHEQQVAVGPGKGSGAGSLVGYLLGLSDVCPLAMTLCFERFLNPERPELPDIDLDVCWRRREEVLAHLSEKHGQDRVARLGVVQHLGARGALRLAGQALGLEPSLIDPVAKACGHRSLPTELASNPGMQAYPWSLEPYATWIAAATALEGLPDHVGLHPCGMAICPQPLQEVAPLMRAPDGRPMVQADKDTSEDLGLLKVDILSNRGLSILAEALEGVKAAEGVALQASSLPVEDAKAFALIATGRAYGISQLESRPVQNLLRQFKPSSLEDMTAITSLYRPGPISSGAKDAYIACRHGLSQPRIPHPDLAPILGHTFGTVIFQEQVIQVAYTFAGMSLGQGDLLRRALLHRQRQELEPLAKAFLEGARAKGHPEALVAEVFQLAVVGPSGYGFVKAHAAASQVIAMRQAYLKARWPVHYMAAVLNTQMGYYPPRIYLEDARHFGAELLGPCVNRSALGFQVQGLVEGAEAVAAPPGLGPWPRVWLRAGLQGIAQLGDAGARHILEARGEQPFASFADFLQRTQLERDALQHLVQVGAADAFGLSRPQLLLALDRHLAAPRPPAGQGSLFAPVDVPISAWPFEGLSPQEARNRSEALLGYPLGPPAWAQKPQALPLNQVPSLPPGSQVTVLAELVHVRRARTKDGKSSMAFLMLSDGLNHLDAVAFPQAYRACRKALMEGGPLWWRGRLGRRPGEEGVLELDSVLKHNSQALPPAPTPNPEARPVARAH